MASVNVLTGEPIEPERQRPRQSRNLITGDPIEREQTARESINLITGEPIERERPRPQVPIAGGGTPVTPVEAEEEGGFFEGTAVGRVIGEFVEGLGRAFDEDADPIGLNPETKARLVEWGLFDDPLRTDPAARITRPLKKLNEYVVSTAAGVGDLVLRGVVGTYEGRIKATGQVAEELGMSRTDANRLERDLHALAESAVIAAPLIGVTSGASRTTRAARAAERREALRQEARRAAEQRSQGMKSPLAAQQVSQAAVEATDQAVDEALLAQSKAKIGGRTAGEAADSARFGFGDKLITDTLDALKPIEVVARKGARATKANAEQIARDAADDARRATDRAGRTGKAVDRKRAEKAVGRAEDLTRSSARVDPNPDLNPYNEMRLLAGVRGTLESLFDRGTFRWSTRGELEFDGGESFKDIFAGVDNLDGLSTYFAARRAKELHRRGIKTPFSADEVENALMLSKKHPEYAQAFDKYQSFNRRVLDFAEQSGLLDAETKARFLEAGENYVPYYRLLTDEGGQIRKTGAGVFRRLKGGDAPLQEIVDNMSRNAASWVELSIKNRALRDVIDQVDRFGFDDIAERIPQRPQMARLADDEARAALEGLGMAKPGKGVAVFTSGRKPLGENVVQIFRNGQREFWRIKDPTFLKSINAVGPKSLNFGMRILSGFSTVLRRGVTLSPDFMARNLIRDIQSAFIQAQTNVGFATGIPRVGIDAARGIGARLRRDDDYWNLILNGGGFATTYAGETGAGRNLRRFYEGRGVNYANVLDTPRKVADGVEALSSGFEMANRLGEYRRAIREGKSPRVAALMAREVSTDFGMRGASSVVQFFTTAVPFLNARAQGLWRLARAGKADPGKVALRGLTSMTIPALGLYALNKDNPDYKALPDWVRDQHFVIPRPDGGFYLVPKGFEAGALFGTVPERLFELIEHQHGGRFADFMLRTVIDTFSFNPLPQAVKPALEGGIPGTEFGGFNRRFGGRPVIPSDLERLEPRVSEQFRPWTSDTLRELAQGIREHTGVEVSPMQVEHLIRGYFGTLGAYVLGASDWIVRHGKEGEAPTMRLDEIPLVKSFVRTEPLRGAQFQTEFYELLGEARGISTAVSKIVEEGREPDLTKRERKLFALRDAMDEMSRQAAEINAGMRAVQTDTSMTAEEKRAQLDRLQAGKNELFEKAMRGLQASPNVSEAVSGSTPVPPRRRNLITGEPLQ